MSIPSSYCLKCRGNTGNRSPHVEQAKNGAPVLKTICTSCGKRKSKFIPKNALRQGTGFFRDAGRWLTGAAGSALGGLLGSVVPGGGSIIGSAAGGYGGSQLGNLIFGKGVRHPPGATRYFVKR